MTSFASRCSVTFISSTCRLVRPLLTQTMGETARAQVTNRVMLVRPSSFNYNPQTAVSNDFQSKVKDMNDAQVQEQAVKEFETLVEKLKGINVSVKIFEDSSKISPDAVFPNNWISLHSEGGGSKVVVYPLLSQYRREERRPEMIEHWTKTLDSTLIDYSHFEGEGKFLEGTGSMILDRVNRIVYACTSPRTHPQVLDKFCEEFHYKPIVFRSALCSHGDGQLQDVYHTNVMMSVGEGFAVVCLESILDEEERSQVVRSLEMTSREVVDISAKQVCEFAGNVLQLAGLDGRRHLMMSARAHASFSPEQLAVFHRHCDSVVPVPLDVIERAGGGSVRCMIAEVFPPLPENS